MPTNEPLGRSGDGGLGAEHAWVGAGHTGAESPLGSPAAGASSVALRPARLWQPAGSDALWNRGISACAVGDGAAPIFRNKLIAVVGAGDSAMEEANFLTKYGSRVCIIHRRDAFHASKIMQAHALSNPKIQVVWYSEVVEAYGRSDGGPLAGVKVKNLVSGEVSDFHVAGLFFAIGHEPATKFLGPQLELDPEGYVATKPGSTHTSVKGVFAAGDVQDKKYRQAITVAGSGIMSVIMVKHLLEELAAIFGLYINQGRKFVIPSQR
ncbi:thioredoxin reductase NTRA-like [Lolium rigidum]|uniref:thioredoxin reductase NTRA-like n=1 Tax=Lolium rigidum TaxID=89674 RepID=UPI001F5D900B|nr:thioredoxin reductase NTRA-like [Lolium rigidum]